MNHENYLLEDDVTDARIDAYMESLDRLVKETKNSLTHAEYMDYVNYFLVEKGLKDEFNDWLRASLISDYDLKSEV